MLFTQQKTDYLVTRLGFVIGDDERNDVMMIRRISAFRQLCFDIHATYRYQKEMCWNRC